MKETIIDNIKNMLEDAKKNIDKAIKELQLLKINIGTEEAVEDKEDISWVSLETEERTIKLLEEDLGIIRMAITNLLSSRRAYPRAEVQKLFSLVKKLR